MDGCPAPGCLPPRGRRVHLIRHGQSTFNAVHETTGSDPGHRDAPLTALGRSQAAAARPRLDALAVELAVSSPFTRALHTSLLLFQGRGVPIVVEALCRERRSASCDVGRSPAELAAEFPSLDFSALRERWWYQHPRGAPEPLALVQRRAEAFLDWLRARPERSIAVVSHAGFLKHLCGRALGCCELHTLLP